MKKPVKILVIDAITSTSKLLSGILKKIRSARFDCIHVRRLSEATRWLAKNTADVIIMGLWLPDGFGRESLATLKAVTPGTPVVVLADDEDLPAARSLQHDGAEGFLARSMKNGIELFRLIAGICRQKNLA